VFLRKDLISSLQNLVKSYPNKTKISQK